MIEAAILIPSIVLCIIAFAFRFFGKKNLKYYNVFSGIALGCALGMVVENSVLKLKNPNSLVAFIFLFGILFGFIAHRYSKFYTVLLIVLTIFIIGILLLSKIL